MELVPTSIDSVPPLPPVLMAFHLVQGLHDHLISPGRLVDIALLGCDPALWLRMNISHLEAITSQYPEFTKSLRPDFLENALFPRLQVFVICFLLVPAPAVDTTQVLTGSTQKPTEVAGLTIVEKLAIFQVEKSYLCRQILSRPHGAYPVKEWAKGIIQHDVVHIGALVLQCLATEEGREAFLQEKESPSTDQNLVDLLQGLLDFPLLHSVHYILLRALLKLSKRTGLFPQSLCHYTIDEFETVPIGLGGFSDVYRGSLHRQPVAVKVMRKLSRMSPLGLMKKFSQEAILWSHVKHPNILPFYGVYLIPDGRGSHRISLLSPWMDNGNVIDYVKANPKVDREKLILDMAHGLEYLHSFSPPIVHGDLKGDNILVSPSGRACLGDFGLGRLLQDKQWLPAVSSVSTLLGAQLYLAPELLDEPDIETGRGVSKSLHSDMYSFGCICYEIYAGHPRFSEIAFPVQLLSSIAKNSPCARPTLMVNDELWENVNRCWDPAPDNRPPITEFITSLQLRAVPGQSGALGSIAEEQWDGAITSKIRSKTFDIVEQIDTSPSYVIAPVAGDTGKTGLSTKILRPHAGAPPPMNVGLVGIIARLDKTLIMQQGDIIILVFGAPLSGKSTFINNFFSNPYLTLVHHQLFPPSHEMEGYFHVQTDTNRSSGNGRSLVLVDTPGLFSWRSNDLSIIRDIVDLFLKGYDHQKTIRVLYLHDITSPRMSADVLMSLSLLKALCGRTGLKNVWMATTQWNLTPGGYTDDSFNASPPRPLPKGFEEREGHLKSVYWKECLEGGAHYWRIQGHSHERALVEDILQSLAATGNQPSVPDGFAIQKEMKQDRVAFPNTETGKAMKSCLLRALEEEVKSGGDRERIEALKRQQKELTRTTQSRRRFSKK